MSKSEFLKKLNRLRESKQYGTITPNEFSDSLVFSIQLINSSLSKGYMKSDAVEDAYQLFPNSPVGYSINHHNLDKPRLMMEDLMRKYGLFDPYEKQTVKSYVK